jgi:CBS domain-containing protein
MFERVFRKRSVVNVRQLMSHAVRVCQDTDSLSQAAKVMWEADCGCVPVVDAQGKAVAMITDRDVCMAGFTQGQALSQIPVSSAASRTLVSVLPDDSLETAEALMGQYQLRRLPVIDTEGRPVGILSLNDLARHAAHQRGELAIDNFMRTLAFICEPSPKRTAAAE